MSVAAQTTIYIFFPCTTQLETSINLIQNSLYTVIDSTLQFVRMKIICLFETQFETQFKIDLCETLRSQQNGEAVKEETTFLHS